MTLTTVTVAERRFLTQGIGSTPRSLAQTNFRYYLRLGSRPTYRNRCIGRAVASLQRILCSFQGTENFDLRQARRALSFAYRDGASFHNEPISEAR
jgi:hypothetical protein